MKTWSNDQSWKKIRKKIQKVYDVFINLNKKTELCEVPNVMMEWTETSLLSY